MAKELEAAGAHVLGLKDMAGLLKPAAAAVLIPALKDAVDLPIHFHTHDTAGVACGTILEASAAGVDAVDCAMDALSGNTSQATLGTVVELRFTERDTGLDIAAIREMSDYWEAVRAHYAAFEAACRPPPPRSISTRCRAGSSPTSRRRRGRWGWRIAGTRWRRCMRT
jgi:pyruvate carboxylase